MPYFLIAVFLAVHIALGVQFIRSAGPTYDEPVHLASGYTYWATGRYRLNIRDHPPLAEMLAAVPLLFRRPLVFPQHPAWLSGRLYDYSDFFLYHNRVDADVMMRAARTFGFLVWTLSLAFGVVLWARRAAGWAGAVGAAAVYAFSPALLSNLALVATDGGSAVLFFLTIWTLSTIFVRGSARAGPATPADGSARVRPAGRAAGAKSGLASVPPGAAASRRMLPEWARWALAGACLGLANGAKFNMIVLVPIAAAVLFLDGRMRGEEAGPRRAPSAAGVALGLLAAAAALLVVYRFDDISLYWDGLSATLRRLENGRSGFFFGRHSITGFAWYFPVALAIKTPLAVWLLAALGLRTLPARERLWSGLPPALYFAVAMTSKVQIGYRHVLPVVPFLILWAGCGAAWLWNRRGAPWAGSTAEPDRPGRVWGIARAAGARPTLAALLAWQAWSVARIRPYFLAYFNEAVGGPSKGYECLVDSNLDWGQDLPSLARALRTMGSPPIYLSYFGTADPAHFGLDYLPVAFSGAVARAGNVADPAASGRVLLAVSATNLQCTYFEDKTLFDWLKRRTPLRVIGYSIFLYDLTSDPDGRRELARLLGLSGNPGAARALLLYSGR